VRQPSLPPRGKFGGGFATVEAFVDDGKPADAHEPEIRRSRAHALARLIGLAADGLDAQALLQAWKPPPDRGQWPVPHNALFDFEATSAGTECIHEITSKARKILDNPPGKMVVGHADWSAKHFRFEEGRVCVIYDWDSLRLDKEINLLGHTAAHFSFTESFDVPRRASPEEARLFVEEYEMARRAPFSEQECVAISAAATYGLAYTARCEHALVPEGKDKSGSFREALSSCGEKYLHPRSRLNCWP
jgi:hypothetical protein